MFCGSRCICTQGNPSDGIEQLKIHQLVLQLLGKIDFREHGRAVEPVLLDALLFRYGSKSFDALWADSAAARAALTRIIMDDISIASSVHRGLVSAAATMPVCPASHLLNSLPISLFLTCWQVRASHLCPSQEPP